MRLGELDKLMAKLYEDNVLGRVTDDFFQMMMKNYEREQKELTMAVANGEQVLQSSEQKSADTRLLIRTFREMTDIKELTPIIVNKLIERIEVHNNDKTSGHCYVKVDVYFTGVGMISIPSEEELLYILSFNIVCSCHFIISFPTTRHCKKGNYILQCPIVFFQCASITIVARTISVGCIIEHMFVNTFEMFFFGK